MEGMNPKDDGTAKHTVLLVFILYLGPMLSSLAGCGGGSTGTTLISVSNPSLTSVQVSPLNPSINAGVTQQFFATAIYSDNSTQDVTSRVTWTSSDLTKATIQGSGEASPGLATGVAAGSVTIKAVFHDESGSSSLTVTSSNGNAGKIPLMDMTASQNYLNFQGGLYENSSDTVPADHNAAGLTTAAEMQPLDEKGNASPAGKVVFVAIGRSTEVDEFSVFASQAASSSAVNQTTLVITNGALSGAPPCVWTVANGVPPCDPTLGNQYDRIRDTVLAPLGVTENQVQVIWIEEYNADPAADAFQSLCDPMAAGCLNDVGHTEALRYEQQLGGVLRAAKTRWPNLKQAFHSSRIYGGYATTDHNSEPYAYEYGFSVKWLIEAQILQMRTGGSINSTAGDLNYQNGTAPWTAWGPYLWANGDAPRSDGLVWCDGQSGAPCNGGVDFQADGTHPNDQGDQKVANLLMNFFLNSPYTPWFRP